MDTEKKPSKRGLYIGIGVSVAFLAVVAGSVVWALGSAKTSAPAASVAPAFESAMRKAGVTAEYPADPVELTSVVPSGAHPFSATFSADEIAALLSTLQYTANVDGTEIVMRSATMEFPEPGVSFLRAKVEVQGTPYSATLVAPVAFEDGKITSQGATKATAEGFSLNASRRAQLTDGVITYANEYLSSAPGLTVESAEITADGLVVTGRAPDSISFR